jgi:hypothetical protein
MKAQPWAVALGCFVAGSLAAAGIASATSAPTKIPDSTTGVITACMVKKTGAVRFINAQAGKTCTKKEKKITFNQTGPQGPVGEKGATGPSKTYVHDPDGWLGIPILTTPSVVATVKVPTGNYLLQAQTSAWKPNNATTAINCEFTASSGTVTGDKSFWTPLPTAAGALTPMSLTATLTNASGETTVNLTCVATGADAVAAPGAVLTATEVGEVVVQ